MNGSRTKPCRRAVSPATTRATSPSAAASKSNHRLSDGPERNPLIDDLFDDLSTHSDSGGLGRLQGESVSNRGSFSEFKNAMQRPSTATSVSMRSGSNLQSRTAIDVICKTAQHFVHAMRMNELDDFFFPSAGLTAEEALHRQLNKKTPQEVEAVVQVLVELLEDVRKARATVAPLTGSIALLGGRERAMSTSMFSTVSTASLMRPPVHETSQLAMTYDKQGNPMINCYTIIANLGQGAYGKVKLGVDASTGQNVAIKIIDKKHLKKKIGGLGAKDQDAALKREIAIMKKVRHRNCVSLYEVIDDPASNKLYLIMDYVPNGPVVRLKPQLFTSVAIITVESGAPLNGEVCSKYLMRCAVRQRADGGDTPLTPEEVGSHPTIYACKPVSQHLCALYLRQLVSGLRYMHKRHLVHHDIKPDNILLGSDHNVFLTDFGVSEILSTHEGEKEAVPVDGQSSEGNANTSSHTNNNDISTASISVGGNAASPGFCGGGGGGGGPKLGGGTLLFTSPELFDPAVNQSEVDPYATDVWALGVTLYCMLIGMTPFFGRTLSEVRQNIMTQAYPWNEKNIHNSPLAPEWRTILDGLLEKNPKQRWTLQQLKTFLDQGSFQEKMRQMAAQDAAAKAAVRAASDASYTFAAQHSRMEQLPLPIAVGAPEVVTGMDSVVSQSNHVMSSSAAMSALSMGSGIGMNTFFFGMDVSQAELSQATRAARVEVTERRLVVSAHTRMILQRFVERVRAQMRSRNHIQMSSEFSPFDAQFPAESTPSIQLAGNASKTSSGGAVPALFLEVPVLSVAASFHRTSAHLSSGASGNQRNATNVDMRPHHRHSHSSRGSGNATDNNIAHRVHNFGSQSIDAILSIVNLQSTSNAFSRSFSFESSSDTLLGGCGAPMPTVTETVAATAALTPAEVHISDAASIDTSVSSGQNVPGNAMVETVMWCGTGRPPSTVTNTSLEKVPSSAPKERRLERGSSEESRPTVDGARRKMRVGHTFLASETAATHNSKNNPCNVENRSEAGESTQKLREDSPSYISPGTSPVTNRTESLSLLPLSHTRNGVSTSSESVPLQHRLSNGRAAQPVLTSIERVPSVKRVHSQTSRLHK
jgi:serine/threonine protein kinase